MSEEVLTELKLQYLSARAQVRAAGGTASVLAVGCLVAGMVVGMLKCMLGVCCGGGIRKKCNDIDPKEE